MSLHTSAMNDLRLHRSPILSKQKCSMQKLLGARSRLHLAPPVGTFAARPARLWACRASNLGQQPEPELPQAAALKGAVMSYARLMFLTGACVAASVMLDRRPALAASTVPEVYTEDNSRAPAVRRQGLWRRVTSATVSPIHALDRLLFPDEPITLIRTSRDFSNEAEAASRATHNSTPAADSASTVGLASQQQLLAEEPAVAASPVAASVRDGTTSSRSIAASSREPAAPHEVVSSLGRLLSAVAPSWPAESCALSGMSHMASGLHLASDGVEVVVPGSGSSAAGVASSTALARQLVRGSYALVGLVMAVVAWQVAASIPGTRKAVASQRRRTPQAAATTTTKPPAAVDETSGMLSDPDGSSCLPGQPAAAAAVAAAPVVVLNPADPHPPQLQGVSVVGPYCVRPTPAASVPAAAVAGGSVLVQTHLPPELQGKQVVGPYCLQPSAESQLDLTALPLTAQAAAAATAEALQAEAAAMAAAASASTAADELSGMLSTEAAAAKAGAVMEAAAIAASAAEQQADAAAGEAVACQEVADEDDEHPLFRVELPADSSSHAAAAVATMEGNLAAEAVREALVAESAAAAAAVAAGRAHAAAHLIEEAHAAAAHAAAHTAAGAAAHTAAAAAAVAAVARAKVDAAAAAPAALEEADGFTPGPASESDVAQLAAEAKEAEAAAAAAAVIFKDTVLGGGDSADAAEEDSAVQAVAPAAEAGSGSVSDAQALIAEAVAAEAAAESAVQATVEKEQAADGTTRGGQAVLAEAVADEAKLSQAQLIAEAIAAEAAAVAAHAAADAAGSAAAADGSAGEASELVKCMMCSPHSTGTSTGTAADSLHLPAQLTVSWVMDMGSSAHQQLTALAAASGHPAIVTSSDSQPARGDAAAAAPAQGVTSVGGTLGCGSTDADAFKDEFAVSSNDGAVSSAVDGFISSGANSSSEAGRGSSLADALDVVSHTQMQAASATAVQLAQQVLAVRLYRARPRAAPAPAPTGQKGGSTRRLRSMMPASPLPAGSAARVRAMQDLGVGQGVHVHLGVSDVALALALALASLDAAEEEEEVGEVEQTSSSSSGPASPGNQQADDCQAQGAAAAALVVSQLDEVSSSSRGATAEQSVIQEAAAPAAEAAKGGDATPGSFPVTVTAASNNPYSALAEALNSSSSSFDVPIQVEPADKSSTAASNSNGGSSSSTGRTGPAVVGSFKGFGSAPGSARVVRYPAGSIRRQVGGFPFTRQQQQDRPAATPAAAPLTPARAAANSASSSTKTVPPKGPTVPEDPFIVWADNSASSIPIEWISTSNSSKRYLLKERAAAILADDRSAATAAEGQQAEETEQAKRQAQTKAAAAVAAVAKRQAQAEAAAAVAAVAKRQAHAEAAAAVAAVAKRQAQAEAAAAVAAAATAIVEAGNSKQDTLNTAVPAAADSDVAGADPEPSQAAEVVASSSSDSFAHVAALLAPVVEPEVADVLASAAKRLDQQQQADDDMAAAFSIPLVFLPGTRDTASNSIASDSQLQQDEDQVVDIAAAYDIPQLFLPGSSVTPATPASSQDDELLVGVPASDSTTHSGLPLGWGVAAHASQDSSEATAAESVAAAAAAAPPRSWSRVSSQLTAELEGELPDLISSAAARLDDEMSKAYASPVVHMPTTVAPPPTPTRQERPAVLDGVVDAPGGAGPAGSREGQATAGPGA